MNNVLYYLSHSPQIDKNTFIAPGSLIIGNVTIMEGASIWYNSVLRGDVNSISIGAFSNIQDNTTVHADSGRGSGLSGGLPTIVGAFVTVGHNCVLHACTIEDYCLIGMGSIILDGAIIGKGSIIGAGTVVTKNTVIPPCSIVVGTPGKVIRTIDESSFNDRKDQAIHYYHLAMENKNSLTNEH